MKILKFIKTAFIWIGIVIFLTVLVYLFILLFINFDSFANIKQLLGFIFQIIVSLGFYSFFKKQIKKYLKEYNNMTKTIFTIIQKEPLILILIWILNFYSIYAVPIYSVSVTLTGLDAAIAQDNVQVDVNGNKINLKEEDGNIFKSNRCYSWNETLQINVGDVPMRTVTDWPIFPFKELISGYEINVRIPDADSVNVHFDQIQPTTTTITLYNEQNELIATRCIEEVFRIKKGSRIRITLSADNYDSVNISHFIVSNNTTITRQLRPKPAHVNFIATNNYGKVEAGFTVFARESTNDNQGEWHDIGKSGEIIPIPSKKKWDFYLAKRRNNGDSLHINKFKMYLKAGEEIDSTFVYEVVE